MIEDMENKDILDKVRMKGMNQGIWLAVQELAHDGRWTQAAEELVSSCGLTEDECRKLQEESGSFDDEMLKFIDTIFGRKIDLDEDNQMIDIDISTMKVGDTYSFADNLKDIGYHKIGSIFKYNTGMEKIELEVIEIDDSSCDGCVFNNRGYYRMYSCCCNIDREDNTNVIYKEVKRS